MTLTGISNRPQDLGATPINSLRENDMIQVTRPQLYAFLQCTNGDMDETYEQYVAEFGDQPTEQAITEELFIALRDMAWRNQLTNITVDFGQTIVTWYGDGSEVLIASYDCRVVEIV